MKNRSTLKVFIYLSFVFTLSYSRWPLASSSQVAYKNRNEKQKHIKSVHLFVCLLFFLKSFVFSFLTVGGASGSLIVSRVHINNVLANISSPITSPNSQFAITQHYTNPSSTRHHTTRHLTIHRQTFLTSTHNLS